MFYKMGSSSDATMWTDYVYAPLNTYHRNSGVDGNTLHKTVGVCILTARGGVCAVFIVSTEKTLVCDVEVFIFSVIPLHTTGKQHPEGCCHQYHKFTYMDRDFHTHFME